MITEDYVSFETAKLLKKRGFGEKCTHYYKNEKYLVDLGYSNIHSYANSDLIDEFSAPTLQMAMKWLREVHKMYIEVCTDRAYYLKDIVFRPAIYDKDLDCVWESDNFSTYEEACEAAIKYCMGNLI